MSTVTIVRALNSKNVETACITDLFDELKQVFDPRTRTGGICYEYFDSDSMKAYVRPYIDWECIEPVPGNLMEILREPMKHLDTLGIMQQLHETFGTNTMDDWAIACDTRLYSRPNKKAAELKISDHRVCTKYKIRLNAMKRVARKLHRNDKYVDTAVYRNGLNKWRIPFTKKSETDIESLMRPLNHYADANQFSCHLISAVDTTLPEFNDGPKIVQRRTEMPDGYIELASNLDEVLQKYTIVSKRTEEDGRIEFLNIKEYECINGPHRSNHNFLKVDRILHTVTLYCHSLKCKGWSKLVYGAYRGDTNAIGRKFDIRTFHGFIQMGIDDKGNEVVDKDATYAMRKQYFDQFHFKTQRPLVYVNIDYGTQHVYSRTDFMHLHENLDSGRFINRWLRDMSIQTYQAIDFIPPPLTVPRETFNTWTGFPIERDQKFNDQSDTILYTPMLDLLHRLCGKSDEVYEYGLNYCAHLVQRPGELPECALIFQSTQGTGKDAFWTEFMGYKVLGQEYTLQTADIEHIVGKFNKATHKLLIIYDEADFSDTNKATHKLKNIITATHLQWEQKYSRLMTVRNCARMIYTTNQSNPIRIEPTDRRHMLIVCDNEHAQDPGYFTKIFECIHNDLAAIQFYKYLKTRDISAYSPKQRVNTQAYSNLKELSVPRVIEFLYEIYVTQQRSTDDINIPGKLLYQDYRYWEETNYARRKPTTRKRFGFEIKAVETIHLTRKAEGMYYSFKVSQLEAEIKHHFEQ